MTRAPSSHEDFIRHRERAKQSNPHRHREGRRPVAIQVLLLVLSWHHALTPGLPRPAAATLPATLRSRLRLIAASLTAVTGYLPSLRGVKRRGNPGFALESPLTLDCRAPAVCHASRHAALAATAHRNDGGSTMTDSGGRTLVGIDWRNVKYFMEVSIISVFRVCFFGFYASGVNPTHTFPVRFATSSSR